MTKESARGVIGSLNTQHREATVIGAGLAGLLAAYRLDRAGFEVTLLEASSRSGGLVSTTFSEHGLSESAAHSILGSEAVRSLCRELKVELIGLNSNSKARYIVRDGKLRRFPLTFLEAVRAFFRAYFVLSNGKQLPGDLSLEQWGLRHLGQAPVEYLLDPFVRGIYASRPSEVQIGAAFPKLAVPHGHSLLSFFLAKKLRSGSSPQKDSARGMVVPRNGMQALTDALHSHLKDRLGDRFQLNHPVKTLPSSPNLVLCVPPPEAAKLLVTQDAASARALGEIQFAPLVSITAFAAKKQFKRVPHGVGLLVPKREGRSILGILFNSSSFTDRVSSDGLASFTVMLSGTTQPELLLTSDDELILTVQREFKELLGFQGQLTGPLFHRWPNAIPIYDQKISEAWKRLASGWCARPGRIVFGNYTGEISIRGMIESSCSLGSGKG